MTDPLEEPTSARHRLAAALRSLRVGANFDQATLAQRIDIAQPQVSRIENVRRTPSAEVVTAWAQACQDVLGTTVDVNGLLVLADAAAAERVSWRQAHAQGLASHQEAIGRIERRAVGIRVFQSSIIPGQLQIGPYSRRVLEMGTAQRDDADIAAAVQARLDRQLVLHDPPRDGCHFVITEAALRWRPIGDTDGRLLAAQLDRLLAILELPRVDLRVLPWDMPQPATHRHPFVLYTFDEDTEGEPDDMVIVETVGGEDVVRVPEQVAAYRDRFELFAGVALAGADARQLIHRIVDELGQVADGEA